MKFTYFNDTGRDVNIHLTTNIGVETDRSIVKPLEERVFKLPKNTYPLVKMWDYSKSGLSIHVVAKEIN